MKQCGLKSHLHRVNVLNVEIFVITVEESLLQEINGYKITENSGLKTKQNEVKCTVHTTGTTTTCTS